MPKEIQPVESDEPECNEDNQIDGPEFPSKAPPKTNSIGLAQISPEKKHEFDKDTMSFWFMVGCVLVSVIIGAGDYIAAKENSTIWPAAFELIKSLALLAAGFFFAKTSKH